MIKDNSTIEQKVAAAILQDNIAELEIQGRVYKVAAPSIATLIRVSEMVSSIPVLSTGSSNEDNMITSVLANAKNYRVLGLIMATLILGSRDCKERKTVDIKRKKHILGFFKRERITQKEITIDRKQELADLLLENMSPSTLWNLILKRLVQMEIGDFFVITTSLNAANLLKPTTEVENKTTASGQQS